MSVPRHPALYYCEGASTLASITCASGTYAAAPASVPPSPSGWASKEIAAPRSAWRALTCGRRSRREWRRALARRIAIQLVKRSSRRVSMLSRQPAAAHCTLTERYHFRHCCQQSGSAVHRGHAGWFADHVWFSPSSCALTGENLLDQRPAGSRRKDVTLQRTTADARKEEHNDVRQAIGRVLRHQRCQA